MLQSPVWGDPYVGTHRESGEKILVLTWWCFAVNTSVVSSTFEEVLEGGIGGTFCAFISGN